MTDVPLIHHLWHKLIFKWHYKTKAISPTDVLCTRWPQEPKSSREKLFSSSFSFVPALSTCLKSDTMSTVSTIYAGSKDPSDICPITLRRASVPGAPVHLLWCLYFNHRASCSQARFPNPQNTPLSLTHTQTPSRSLTRRVLLPQCKPSCWLILIIPSRGLSGC